MARNDPKSTQNFTKHIRITFCMHNSSIPSQNYQKNRKWENSIFKRYIALHTALHIALQRAILQHCVQVKIRIFQKWPGMPPNRPRTSPNTPGSRFACISFRSSSYREKARLYWIPYVFFFCNATCNVLCNGTCNASCSATRGATWSATFDAQSN